MRRMVWLALAGAVWAAPPPPPTSLPALPGWTKTQSTVSRSGGWGLSPVDAAAMSEYGLQTLERAVYTRAGAKLSVEGLRFADAGGAFGAFTYYRAEGNFLRRGRWLVRADGDAKAVQGLTRALGEEATPGTTLPAVPFYLPRDGQVANSLHFMEGPVAFAAVCPWMAAAEVGFDHSAEAAIASYGATGGTAQVLVISYPTPQMARTRLPQMQRLGVGEVRRSGPLLVVVHGAAGNAAAELLQSVKFDAAITLTPSVPVGVDALPSLILSIFLLCGLLIAIAIGVGVLTGAARVWLDRVLPERFRMGNRDALIRLNLGRFEP